MLVTWTSSERLRLLKLQKEGAKWPAIAEKLNEEYRERPKNFFNEKNCKAEFDRILNEPCPKSIAPDEPSQSFKRADVIDAWITDLRIKVRLDADKRVETELVELRKMTQLIENIMSKNNCPSPHEMAAMTAQIKEDSKKKNRDSAALENIERVESAVRKRFDQIFKEQRESNSDADTTILPGSLSISPTKASSVALQNAFRSPSPIKSPITSPIRPLAEAIEEADAEMGELFENMEEPAEEVNEEVSNELPETVEDPKMEVESPVASPKSMEKVASPVASPQSAGRLVSPVASPQSAGKIVSPIASPQSMGRLASPIASPPSIGKRDNKARKAFAEEKSVSPRTAVDMAIGEGGLEEEMEEEDDEEEPAKEEKMEVDEKVEEAVEEKKEEEKPMVTRKSTRVSSMSVDSTPSTPVTSGKEKKKKDPSPPESSTSKKEEKEKEDAKEDEGRGRRTSMRGRPPSTPVVHSAPSMEEEEKEEGTKTRRSSRVEKIEEKKEDKREKKKEEEKKEEKEEEKEDTKRRTRKSMMEKEEKEKEKEEVTFVAPSVSCRTRQHRGSEQTEEKEKDKSEEPTLPKTRSSGRPSTTGKSTPESKESPAPPDRRKRGERGEKKEESEEKEIRTKKETSVANSEKSAAGVGGKRDIEVLTEISIRHPIAPPPPASPSKTRRGTERESPIARKASRTSVCSSNNGKPSMASVEVQTEKVEMRHEDEVWLSFNSNERYFTPVHEIERGRGRPRKEKEKEIKMETDEEKPNRRTRGGEMSDDEGGSRSGSFSQSDKGLPSRRKESKRDLLTIRLDVDDDTGRYWLQHNDAVHVEPVEGPSSAKKRSLVSEISHRRSMAQMEPMKQALNKACKDMELHRHSSVFKTNVPLKDAPDYYDCVKQAVCITSLKADVQKGLIKDPVSLQRRFTIMFMNGAMYNSTAHDYWTYAVEMNKETYRPVRDFIPELMVQEAEDLPKQTRGRRNNEPAFAKDAVLTPRDRSVTHDRSFKCESVDTEADELGGMDFSSDDHRVLYTRSKVDTTRKRKI